MNQRTLLPLAIAALGTAALSALTACSNRPSSSSTSPGATPPRNVAHDGIPAARGPAKGRPTPDLSRPHGFGVQDMVRMERVGAPVPSPDGSWIVFPRTSWDAAANQKSTNLWLVTPDGRTTKPLTTAKGDADGSPVWSPDSKSVLFTSTRGKASKVWIVRVDGGEARPFFDLPTGVDNLRMSPTGKHLAFSSEVYPATTPAETVQRDATKGSSPVKARSYEQLMVRHWDSWNEGKRNHVFVLPLTWSGDGEPTAGEPLDLMKPLDVDCPTRPFGGAEDFVFSPDGEEVAYVAQFGIDAAWSTNLDVVTVPVTGGAGKVVSESNLATDHAPAYSPDGSTLLWLAMSRPGFESDKQSLRLMDRKSGEVRTLAGNWDRSIGAALWAPDSKSIFCTAEEEARQRVFSVDAESGAVKPLLVDHWNDAVALLPGHGKEPARLVFAQDSLTSPADLFRCDLDGTNRLRLTKVNEHRFENTQLSQPEEFWFEGAGGERVHSWILKPVGFEKDKTYPLAFVIHGGPQGVIGDHFHYRWNLEAFAGAGYGVLAVNFHGSTGFGQAFTDSISGDWGGKPFDDLMKGLDAALANYGWIDPKRVGALGASFGGWMINWLNGHTDRFQCLVCHDGEFDEISAYYTTEELWFPEWEFRGVPWEHPDLYERFSPSRFVQNWKTPELVIHSANDFRLTDDEGLAAFTALQRRGVPSKFLWFPDENHWVQKPVNSIRWHNDVVEWLDRWLAPGTPSSP
jgi:dipeptidyl aminopeptidase/acylaminoacyl peptidase